MAGRKVIRSSQTGEFSTKKRANKSPSKFVEETIKTRLKHLSAEVTRIEVRDGVACAVVLFGEGEVKENLVPLAAINGDVTADSRLKVIFEVDE